MADSKTFSGFPVQNLSSDSTSVGQIYYNSTSGQFKAVKDGGAPIGTWASGGNTNTARSGVTGFGINTATIIAGGSTPGVVYEDLVEQYNGTAWTEIADFSTGRNQAGSIGSTTAGLLFGGIVSLNTATASNQSWNGSAWTEVNELNTARSYMLNGSNGTQTAGMTSTGWSGTAQVYSVESWNGSSWAEVAEPNTNVYLRATGGKAPNTNTIIFGGGYLPARTANSETWNGSSWTEVGDLNTARTDMGGSGTSSTSAIGFGGRGPSGSPNATILTESWDGSSWTEVADQGVNTGIHYFASTGASAASALKCAGATTGQNDTTEEWTAAAFEVKTLTTS